jgi:hypothetical protein
MDHPSQSTTQGSVAPRILNLSAFVLLLLFAVAAYCGADILRFEALRNRIWLSPSDEPLARVLDSVSPWTNVSVVATPARSFMLDLIVADTPHDNAAIEGALGEIAAASPTSTAAWLSLAETRKALGAPMESVLAAFRMSSLTGSHEGFFMRQRANFGLLNWSALPEEARQIAIRDIVSSVGSAADYHPEGSYRKIIAGKSEVERDSIRAALLASGLATKDVLQALGM